MNRLARFAALCLGVALPAWTRQLPVKVYTTADGLPHNVVRCMVQDARGFLWFCTGFGLSRFDGYHFTNYGPERGLPDRAITTLLQTRGGAYWAGTTGGLYVLPARPAAGSHFERVPFGSDESSRSITSILEGSNGCLWIGTGRGLYAAEQAPTLDQPVHFRPIPLGRDDLVVESLLEDHQGALWIGATSWKDAGAAGLYRRAPDGTVRRYSRKDGLTRDRITALIEDRRQTIWAGSWEGGVSRLVYDASGGPRVEGTYSLGRALSPGRVADLMEAAEGTIWVATPESLLEWLPERAADPYPFRAYGRAEGLVETDIKTLGQDREGNLWATTESSGVMKIARNGFIRYDERDGLGHTRIRAFLESPAGELRVISEQILINRYDGARFTSLRPRLPVGITRDDLGWGWNQTIVEDRTGEWWVPTAKGLLRFARPRHPADLSRQAPKAIYTSRNGLTGDEVFRVFEDSRGDIWISVLGNPSPYLNRWDRSTDSFHAYGEAAGIPDQAGSPTAFRQDAAGQLWVGFGTGVLARERQGRFTVFGVEDGVPRGRISELHVDRLGRLWMATSRGGVGRIDDPAAERPRFVSITAADGLSSNNVSCIAEDRWGRIYAGTGRGLDRIELKSPGGVLIRHYTTGDGLPPGECTCALGDSHGAVWIGTLQGLAAFWPEPDRPRPPLPVWIGGLRIRGDPHAISDLGESQIPEVKIAAFQNHVSIDFFGISFRAGEVLRYQYKLERADRDWSPPAEQRTVNYSNLTSGAYRFLVRAIDSEGVASSSAASLSFRIVPPVWDRWWARLLAVAILTGMAYMLQRHRTGRLVELERVRTRIAADLHDEIGSSLSQIAILSEVTREQIRSGSGAATDTAGEIAASARTMLDSMSDIVWSIDPRRDSLSSLVQRVNQFASDVLESRGVAWSFEAPESLDRIKLTPEQRRQINLILKEAVHNASRHAAAKAVALRISVTDHQLLAEVRDDGCGFRTDGEPNGYGLASMRARAGQLKGQLRIRSETGQGTQVSLQVPL